MLVLAGPGTGKTTTLVEAVVDRIARRGAAPESVLALTFSRKAAEQLRDRVAGRLGGTVHTAGSARLGMSVGTTFHSFAYALVRAYAPTELYAAPLRILSAAEQDVVIQTLLRPEPEAVPWPESLARGRNTRGFAREVQGLLARAREQGLSAQQLQAIGERQGRPEWVAAGRFLDHYLANLDAQGALDYPDLMARAVQVARDHRAPLRARFRHVFVDEYQDTDPIQEALLQELAGDGHDLVVVGDPDQSIYGFRGADVRGILDFPARFPTAAGARAPVVALSTTRRFGPRLLEAGQRIAVALPVSGSVGVEAMARLRSPEPAAGASADAGRVDVLTFDTPRAEAEHIADLLRRAHLSDGIAWSQMAVLVRSGTHTIPSLRRSLSAAGVPVEVSADDTALVEEPAVRCLLDALQAVVDTHAGAGCLDADRAEALLTSPLGGLDACELRALGRELRHRDQNESGGSPAQPSRELVAAAVTDPAAWAALDHPSARKAASLASLLTAARRKLSGGGTVEDVLWTLWDGTGWPERLRATALGGDPGAPAAHRDLDAVCALFEAAARAEGQRAHTGVATFLATLRAQRIPSDTLAERGVRGDAVRMLTAHRAKGLEWRLVVVAHVQEGSWPDLRRRSTLLRADELGTDGAMPPLTTRTLLAEERRLFYVACTRARERLVVTAVSSADEDGEQPSRFLTEHTTERAVRTVSGRPPRPMSLPGLVAELRRTAADPATSPALRTAAAARLARLALDGVRHADPATWWGTRTTTSSSRPLRDPDQPLVLSGSTLHAMLMCPTRWFLEHEAGGVRRSTASQGFGLVVHALADRVAHGEPADLDELMAQVDRVWPQLAFRTPWSADQERAEVRAALERFLAWHRRPGSRTVIGTEEEIRAEVRIGGERIILRGFADRLELDEQGRVVVVDFKTGKNPPRDQDVPTHAQLGLYQHAVDHGAADHLLAGHGTARGVSGGAELVHLRKQAHGAVKVQSQPPQQPGGSGLTPVEEQIAEAVSALRTERFPARPGEHCDHCDFQAICPVKGAGTVLA
jgi:superfamily I DNA/RNA helicase/RecB family exonuclease